MKKLLLIGILCAFVFSLSAQADQKEKKLDAAKQPAQVAPASPVPSDRPAKCGSMDCQAMMKVKKEYIENNFKLDDKQKDAFWKAYDEYTQAEFNAFKQGRAVMEAAGLPNHVRPDSVQYLSDAQILAVYNSKFVTRENLLTAERNFYRAIYNCLTPKQIDEYYQLERKFKRSAANHQDHKCGDKCKQHGPNSDMGGQPQERQMPKVNPAPMQVKPLQR